MKAYRETTQLNLVSVIVALMFTSVLGKSRKEWSEWSKWTPCSKSCGFGVQKRNRNYIPAVGETASLRNYTQTRVIDCFIKACPTDGSWSVWSSWAECSNMCGGGSRNRTRECINRSEGGKACDGKSKESQKCGQDPCPVLPNNFDLSQCLPKMNFTCKSQRMCIPGTARCDGKVQCHDGTDETGCHSSHTGFGRVRYDLRKGNGCTVNNMAPATLLLLSVITFLTVPFFQ